MNCKICKQNTYTKWLNQMVYISGDNKVHRYEYIDSFAKYITKWIKKHGYKMGDTWGDGVKVTVRWMYAIFEQEVLNKNKYGPLLYPEPFHRNLPEDLDSFEMVIDCEAINEFMENWKSIDELSESHPFGIRVRMEMQEFLYTYVNVESSKYGIKITHYYEDLQKELEQQEEEYMYQKQKGGLDTYVLESQNGWHS
jgi:hypothetical protein